MLRLLLCLGSVYLLADASQITITESTTVNVSACPVYYFGKVYKEIYVNYAPNEITFCFDKLGNITAQDVGDCLNLPATSDLTFEILTDLTVLTSKNNFIKQFSPFNTRDATCALRFDTNSRIALHMLNYEDWTVLVVSLNPQKVFTVYIYTDGTILFSQVFDPSQYLNWYVSLMGCRLETGTVRASRSTGRTFDGCLEEYCTTDRTTANRTTCSGGQSCLNNRCAYKDICVVTGNSVINFLRDVAPIEDFCGVKLLDGINFNLSAYYAERRLTDVPLLDTVKISTREVTLTLGQGGMIRNNTGMVYTTTAAGLTVHDVVFSKVEGGLLVHTVDNSTGISHDVFFDGNNLLIVKEGPTKSTTTGMCADISDRTIAKDSPADCTQVVSDPKGDGIDCDAVKERCEILLEKPFSDCNYNAKPYITACTNLLCNYTDADSLFCDLLDAYARVCELHNWRDSVGCPVSECPNKKCIYENEFCGLSVGSEASCFCRSSYAAPYRAKNTFGADTVCASKTASVTLVGCLLEEKGINISSLHLNDPSCSGVRNPATNEVTFSFNDAENCAANISINGEKIIYQNTILAAVSNAGVIVREDQVSVEFSCAYIQPETQTMSLKITDGSVVKVIDSGQWSYIFNMTAYTDRALTSAVLPSTQLHLDQPLWVKTEAIDVDGLNLALVIQACWATEQNDANAAQKYYLVQNGCPVEETTEMDSNGESLASSFSFKVFQFVGHTGDIYLHCETKLCIKANGCTKTC